MKRTLIVATTSYAGMGPYVVKIVNSFMPIDDIFYFFYDYEDNYFKNNIKRELHDKSIFYHGANSAKNKLINLLTNRSPYENQLLKICVERSIELVHYINSIPSIRMQRRFERMGVIVLSTVHDLEPHEAKKAWHKMWRQNILYRRLRVNLNAAKYIVTNSILQYKELKARYKDKEITYHQFPSLVTKAIADGGEVPPELKETSKPFLLFFGRIEEYKGIALLYKAFMDSPKLKKDYILVIAGRGELGFERRSDEEGVIFINRYIDDSEVAFLYENASAVVYPYISATQSGVLSLAFYFQTPVVSSSIPFFQSLIEPFKTGVLFEKGNSDDLQRILLSLKHTDFADMKRNQKEFYQTHYSDSSLREHLMKIYSMTWSESCLDNLTNGGTQTTSLLD